MFERFDAEVINRGAPVQRETVDLYLLRQSIESAKVIARSYGVICLFQFFFGFFHILDSGVFELTILAEWVGIFSAAALLFALSKMSPEKRPNLVGNSILAYYLSITLVVTILAVAQYTAYPAYQGIPLSSLFYFGIMYFPLQRKLHSAIILTSIFLDLLLLVGSPYPSQQFVNIFLRVIIVIMYLYFAKMYRTNAQGAIQNVELKEELVRISHVDNLTQHLNRYALNAYQMLLEERGVHTVGVVMLDIDDFKRFNDNYSHVAGDRVLCAIGHALITALGEKDRYIFRFGGEEFVVLAPDVDDDELLALAQTYRRTVENVVIRLGDDDVTHTITVSVGAANGVPMDDYMRFGDRQLHNAKHSGKNCVSFHDRIYRD